MQILRLQSHELLVKAHHMLVENGLDLGVVVCKGTKLNYIVKYSLQIFMYFVILFS